MKSLLVIETPDSCISCPLHYYDNLELKCSPFKKDVLDVKCPLIAFPLKRKNMTYWLNEKKHFSEIIKSHEITEYDKGWNDCVDYLEGEEND